MILKGKKVILRPIEQDDIEFIRGLINDPWIEEKIVGWSLPLSKKDQELWYTNFHNTQNQIRYIIESPDEGVVGLTGLTEIDYKNGVATTAGIRVKRELQSKGIATDAYMTMFRFAFSELRLHRINTSALVENVASLRLMEKVGCKREGIQREAVFKGGKFHDVYTLACLKSDYETLIKENHYWESEKE